MKFDKNKVYFVHTQFGTMKLQKTGQKENTYMFLNMEDSQYFLRKKGTFKELINYVIQICDKDDEDYEFFEFDNLDKFIEWYQESKFTFKSSVQEVSV